METNTQLFWINITVLAILGMVAVMVFKYFVKINQDNVILGQTDKEQSKRIHILEEKNGHEQHQIDELKMIVEKQEKRIEELERKLLMKEGEIKGLEKALKK